MSRRATGRKTGSSVPSGPRHPRWTVLLTNEGESTAHLSRPALVAFATTAGVCMSEAPAVAEEHSNPRGTAVVTEATVDGVDENGDGFSTGFPAGQRILLRSSR